MRHLAGLLLLPLAAFGTTISELPQSEYADTEVSTNICFAIDRATMTRVELTVALDATPTNNVEVAIGTDGDGDGNLSVEEAAYTFGYDCGRWFKRSKSEVVVEQCNFSTCSADQPEKESNIHCTVTTNNYDFSSRTFILKMRKLDTAWNLVKVTRRGCGATCELVKAEGRKPGLVLEVR